jgi:hypothetical protein
MRVRSGEYCVASFLPSFPNMRNLPHSILALGFILVGLILTLLGFGIARRSQDASVHTRLVHKMVADFNQHVGITTDSGAPISAPGIFELLLLMAIAGVGALLWRSWSSHHQQHSAKQRS